MHAICQLRVRKLTGQTRVPYNRGLRVRGSLHPQIYDADLPARATGSNAFRIQSELYFLKPLEWPGVRWHGSDMNACFTESALQQMGNVVVSDFDSRVSAIPQDLCSPFHTEASRLESALLTIYRFVVGSVRDNEDLEQVSKQWEGMTAICDLGLNLLSELKQKHPYCGAEIYYDKLLDLRAKCLRLQLMHA